MERAPPPALAAAALAAMDEAFMDTPLSPKRPRQDDPPDQVALLDEDLEAEAEVEFDVRHHPENHYHLHYSRHTSEATRPRTKRSLAPS